MFEFKCVSAVNHPIPIWRQLIRLISKYFVIIFFFVTAIEGPASAFFHFGTFFLIEANSDFIVVAIDSRDTVLDWRGNISSIDDKTCKFKLLPHDSVFFR